MGAFFAWSPSTQAQALRRYRQANPARTVKEQVLSGPAFPPSPQDSHDRPTPHCHDKKVQQEKKHRGEEIAHGVEHAVQPGKKPHIQTTDTPDTDAETADKDEQPAG